MSNRKASWHYDLCQWVSALFIAGVLVAPAGAQEKDKEKDIFNYVAQKTAGKDVKKIVFIADKDTHGGKGNHEFKAGAIYMARTLNAAYPNAYAVVHLDTRWPKDLAHADCVIVLLNHGRKAATDPAVKSAMERGAGFMAIHYGVEVNKGEQGNNFLKWLGGYFEAYWSVNPFWVPKFDKIPEHETTRGVKPFAIKDEWYYHMRFVEDMKGVTPILSAVPELKTGRERGGLRSGKGGQAAARRLGIRSTRRRPRIRLHRLSQLRKPEERQLSHAPLERRSLDGETGSPQQWHRDQDADDGRTRQAIRRWAAHAEISKRMKAEG